ncbi:hypothetical protein BJ508DRAFT_137327 [Ascobolus immersus RN42]|uniref:Small EDRK-rich factor-like N-terminal domain-containing protein n=1 Tax=Ascobolus immersus RN42 TaxID=1160509 RepID=A0A3N4I1B0_ASCIM|nr:hypothetical protein BJ508DRAFT_137327 [Ascobolus immersus RN42]
MTRGNQRDRDREKAQKKLQDQKKGPKMSGFEMQRNKEEVARIMREKQEKGKDSALATAFLEHSLTLLAQLLQRRQPRRLEETHRVVKVRQRRRSSGSLFASLFPPSFNFNFNLSLNSGID